VTGAKLDFSSNKRVKMKALVTGGCGFIGSHLVKKLVERGAEVTVVDDLSSGNISNLSDKGISFRPVIPSLIQQFYAKASFSPGDVVVATCDFVDSQFLSHFVEGGYTHVFHMAANPRVEYSVNYPALSTEVNLMKTVELLSACRQANIEKFVFASSSAVFGDVWPDASSSYSEGDPKKPQSPYGLQKYCCELFMEQFSNLYSVETVALRLFNVYGPGCYGDNPYATAVAAWCDRLSKNESLRSDGDGEQTRDMVYVEDVADAFITVATENARTQEDKLFSVFCVGTGDSISNNNILEMLAFEVGGFVIFNAPARPGDAKHTKASIEKITKKTSWRPNTDFKTGLIETLKWWGIIDA